MTGNMSGRNAKHWRAAEAKDWAELARGALAGRVAADLAHEINDLLVGVLSVATAAADTDGERELRQALDTNAEYGQRIADLVGAFQETFNGGAFRRPPAPVCFTDVLGRCLFLCRHRIRSRRAEVRQRFGALPRVQADVGLMQWVFIELLYRALDTASGGGRVELTAEETGESVAVTLSCETGRSASNVGENGGGGPDGRLTPRTMGLAAARSVIQGYGGELTAHPTLGTAHSFTVRLPVWARSAAP